MISDNSKNSKPHVLIFNLTDKIDLQRSEKSIASSNLSIYNPWKNIKKLCSNNKFKTSTPTWNDKFELPDGSYSLSDIQDYFEYILSKMEKRLIILQIRIYVNKIENRITFKIKIGHYLVLLMPETMKLLGSIESKIKKGKNSENVAHLEILKAVYCHNSNNDYQQHSKVLYTFVPNKPFSSLLEISLTNSIFLKTFGSDFWYIEIWFTN